uniref:Uncharacterized protein n=1 Tax=Timema cristinae TaxID=61476 RepID=A0A7R9CC61_TIMCR|nr:unnamed protein product [Timema cristinae]
MLTLAMRRAEEVPDEGGSNSHQPPPAVNPEEYVDILQVQQILLEGTNRRTRAPPAAGSFPPDQRGRMILEGYPHPHHPPPYYYSNYAQHQQAQAPSVEELFALWFGSAVPGSDSSYGGLLLSPQKAANRYRVLLLYRVIFFFADPDDLARTGFVLTREDWFRRNG